MWKENKDDQMKARIEIRLSVEAAVQIEEIAKSEGRTRKNYIEFLVIERINKWITEMKKRPTAVKAVRQKSKK